MRLFLGIIIGIVLTVGVAYVADSVPSSASSDAQAEAHMVNWDVVGKRLNDLGTTVREAWNRLTGGTAKSGT